MGQRLVFLLGSGVSRAAQMPSVDEITQAVVSGVRDGFPYRKYTEGWYSNSPNLLEHQPYTMDLVLAFIREIQKRCSRYFRRTINYEDIAYVVWQIHEEQSGNYENPALVPLLQFLRPRFKRSKLVDLAREADAYILCLVRDAVLVQPEMESRRSP